VFLDLVDCISDFRRMFLLLNFGMGFFLLEFSDIV